MKIQKNFQGLPEHTSKQMKVAVLGPEYSYSHLVSIKLFPEQELVLCTKIEDVFKAIAEKKVEKGVVPIENMLQGSVRESILGLFKYKVKINHAYTAPIHHCVAGKNHTYIKIASHPQALLQCSQFITNKEVVECASTSRAMELAAENESLAAIGSKEAAAHYGLPILQENVEDNHDNVTRFIVISPEETQVVEKVRTSLLLTPKDDRPGLLFLLLAPFAAQNINLVKIESLPSGRKMGEYVFYIEIDGNMHEEKVKSALEFLRNSVDVYPLGSYQIDSLE